MITPRTFEEILAKKPEKRFNYFMKTVLAEETVWALTDEEGWLLLEAGEVQAMPVFPHQEFAEHFRMETGTIGYHTEPIDLQEFVQWLDDMQNEHLTLAIFPTPDLQSVVFNAERLKAEFIAAFDKEENES